MVALSATSVSSGYDGTVDEKQLAALLPRVGACEYGVDGETDFQVSAVAGADRTVRIRAGLAWGHSVFDVSDADVNVQLGAVSTGSRWDLVVLRRDWQPAKGVSSIVVIPGTSDKTASAAGGGNRKTSPGVVDDQPLALVRVTSGSTVIAEVVDLRAWARNGGAFVVDSLALGYLGKPGARVFVGAVEYAYLKAAVAGFEWVRVAGLAAAQTYNLNDGWVEPRNSGDYIKRFQIPDPGYPYHVFASATVEAGGGGSGTRWDTQLVIHTTIASGSAGYATAPWFQMQGVNTGAHLTGSVYVGVRANRLFGSGVFGLSTYNHFFTIMVVPAAN